MAPFCLALAALTLSGTPAAEPVSSDPVLTLINYGVLGIVVVGFVTGWIAPGPQVKQLVRENERLNLLITGTLLPIIEKVTLVMDQTTSATKRQTEVVEAVRQEMHDLNRGK
jgi:hypothetical protein